MKSWGGDFYESLLAPEIILAECVSANLQGIVVNRSSSPSAIACSS
jgi:hypothetical protein